MTDSTVQSKFAFRWFSPLGIASILFLLWGVLFLLEGILGPTLVARYGPGSPTPSMMDYFLFNAQVDTAYFGRPPLELVQETPAIAKLHTLMINHTVGFFFPLGILQLSIVWFGLRRGHRWALWTLAIGNIAYALRYWVIEIPPVFSVVPVGLSGLHPYALYPTVAVPVATLLGWLGLRGRLKT